MMDLSIAQEYLVCAVNEKGKVSSFDTERMVCVVAAGLLELQLESCIEIEDKRIRVTGPLPEERSYLKPLYDFVDQQKTVKLEKLLEAYNYSFTDKRLTQLTDAIGDSLVDMGAARCERTSVLGKKCFIPARDVINGIIDKIRAELFEDGVITEDVLALVVLLDKSKCMKLYFSEYERKEIKNRLKEIVNSSEGKLVKQMIEYIENMTAIIVVMISAIS